VTPYMMTSRLRQVVETGGLDHRPHVGVHWGPGSLSVLPPSRKSAQLGGLHQDKMGVCKIVAPSRKCLRKSQVPPGHQDTRTSVAATGKYR
jgi:hypothetical protein